MHTEQDFCVSSYSEDFPEKLKNIRRVPEKLYIRGELPDPRLPAVAINIYGEQDIKIFESGVAYFK